MEEQISNADINLNWSWDLGFLNNELKLVLREFKAKRDIQNVNNDGYQSR